MCCSTGSDLLLLWDPSRFSFTASHTITFYRVLCTVYGEMFTTAVTAKMYSLTLLRVSWTSDTAGYLPCC